VLVFALGVGLREVAIHFMHYNFVRIHQTTRVTPAMAAGVTDKLWELSDMVRVIEEWENAREASRHQRLEQHEV
jgi:hypothetical protein